MIKIKPEKKFVAFLDVLGFTNLVKSNRIDKIEKYFNLISTLIPKKPKQLIEPITISDSIILICEKENFVNLIEFIIYLQTHLYYEEIFLRGAITFGDIFYKKSSLTLVGNAYIEAYSLESEAKYPRIIIDPKIIKEFYKSNSTYFLECINTEKYSKKINSYINLTDSKDIICDPTNTLIFDYLPKNTSIINDGFFISYGHKLICDLSYSIEIGKRTVRDWDHLVKIIDILGKNLYQKNNLYEKFFWTKQYFIEILKEFINYKSRIYTEDTYEVDALSYYLNDLKSL